MRDKAAPLFLGAVVVGLGLVFLLGARTIGGDAPHVGPRAMPALVGTGLVVLGLAFMLAVWRGLPFPDAARPARRGVLPWILSGTIGAVLIVESLGFPVAAAWIFVASARAFGSRQWLRNAAIGIVLGFLVYLVVNRVLGVALPGGPIDTLWPR